MYCNHTLYNDEVLLLNFETTIVFSYSRHIVSGLVFKGLTIFFFIFLT